MYSCILPFFAIDVEDKQTDAYLNLITSEHRGKQKYIAWIRSLLRPLMDTQNLLSELYSDFDIDNASGVQLDQIGLLLGQGRTVNFNPTDGSSPALNDSNYRVLLKATIIKNTWTGSPQKLAEQWQMLFPGGQIVITDNKNMTFDVFLTGAFNSVIQDLIEHGFIVPKPAAVKVNYNFGTLPVFGYDYNNEYISGYDLGNYQ